MRLFLKILLTFLITISCFSNEIVTLTGGDHNSITQAINKLNENGTIEVKGDIYVGKNLIIPKGISFHFFNNNKIILESNSVLDFHGFINSGLSQIFETSTAHKLTIYNELQSLYNFNIKSHSMHFIYR